MKLWQRSGKPSAKDPANKKTFFFFFLIERNVPGNVSRLGANVTFVSGAKSGSWKPRRSLDYFRYTLVPRQMFLGCLA